MYIILCTRRYAVDRWPDSVCKQTTTVCIFHNLNGPKIWFDPELSRIASVFSLSTIDSYFSSPPSLLLGISLMPRTLNNTRVPIVFCFVKKSEKEPLPTFPHQSLLLRSYCLMPHVSYICIERVLIFMLFTISNTPEFSIW